MIQKQFTVLIVDSDRALLRFNSSILKEAGHDIFEATTGLETLRLAKEQKPDVVLLGTDLPDIHGTEICRRIKSDRDIGHIPVVLVSTFKTPELAQAATLESGADGYLIPPYAREELIIRILPFERVKRSADELREAGEFLELRVRERTAALEKANEALQKEIAEHKRTEERIRISEEFFREVTEHSSDLVLIIDGRGIITYASPSVERYLGYRPEEMTGKSTFRFFHPAEAERAFRVFRDALSTEVPSISNAFRIIHKDGSVRILEGLGRNLLDHPSVRGFVMNVHDVTERHRVEEASRLFADTLESISEIITITDLNDRFTYVNQAFLKTYGYERGEIIGRHVRMLWSPNNPDGLLKEILEQNRTSSWQGELLNLTKDGREFPLSLHTSRIRNEAGEIVGLVGISEDISERRKTEDSLRESEAKYRELVEQIGDVIFACDMNGVISYISPRAVHLAGYQPEEMIGRDFTEFIEPGFLPGIQKQFRVAESERSEPIEFRVRTKTGRSLWVRGSSRIVFDNGKPVGLRGVLTDITVQKETQETVTMLSHTIRSIGECVTVTDHKNTILFVNRAFLDTYGYTEEELIGKPIEMVNPTSSTVRKVLGETLRGSWQGELVNRKKDGTEFPIYLSTSVVRDEKGDAIALVGVATDITERKKIEQELAVQKNHLQESYEQLKQLEVARDTLVHMIVHDMRSRLFALLMGLEFLEKNASAGFSASSVQVLAQALSSTRVLIGMVNSLLDIGKMESGEMKLKLSICDLKEVVRKLVAVYDLPHRNRQFVVNEPPEAVQLSCDVDLISRVIQNLLSNAIKYTPIDGTITITLLGSLTGITLSVRDSGPGIAPQHLPRIFDKFYQAEAREISTGLGLTFCKLAVELHGGQIGVGSEVGKGSTFWFSLPRGMD